MSRRSSRRTVKVKQTVCYSDLESSDSQDNDNDSSWLQLFAMAFQKSRRRKSRAAGSARKRVTPKKSPRSKAPSRNSPRTHNVTLTVPITSSLNNVSITTSINLEDSVIAGQSKKVEDKVKSFFHNLISDDEDENPLKKPKYPLKDTREFYVISDSDDDKQLSSAQPSTSQSGTQQTVPSTNISNLNLPDKVEVTEIIDDSPSHKEDELMDIVDQILEGTDKNTDINTSEKDQSWSDYKNKAEEILGSISNLLGEISKVTEPKSVEPVPPKESPVKPSCPICFDVLGGEVTAMVTTCGHIFCKVCIEQISKTVKKCPTCRKTLNQKKIHPIYL